MEARVQRIDERLTTVEQQLRQGDERLARLEIAQARLEIAQERNTVVTMDTGKAVDSLSSRVIDTGKGVDALTARVSEPLIYFEKAVMGLKVLGGIGVVGMWLARHWYLFLALAVATRIVASGGSITEAWNGLIRALQLPLH